MRFTLLVGFCCLLFAAPFSSGQAAGPLGSDIQWTRRAAQDFSIKRTGELQEQLKQTEADLARSDLTESQRFKATKLKERQEYSIKFFAPCAADKSDCKKPQQPKRSGPYNPNVRTTTRGNNEVAGSNRNYNKHKKQLKWKGNNEIAGKPIGSEFDLNSAEEEAEETEEANEEGEENNEEAEESNEAEVDDATESSFDAQDHPLRRFLGRRDRAQKAGKVRVSVTVKA